MSENRFRVSIIGGGITGLTAAFYLQKEIQEKALPIEFQLIESSDRLGGKIETYYRDGFVIERGPDSFLERKASAAQLATDVGLRGELVHNNAGQAYILQNDRLLPIPEGAVMGIPTRLAPFAFTSLISPAGKLRAAADLVLPRTSSEEDESVGHFFRRRLGDEVIENLIEPLLSGVYAGNIDNLSLMSTFPQFAQLEKKYRSLILAMKNTRQEPKVPGKPQGIFLTLKSGLQSLVERIERLLPKQSIIKGASLQRVEKTTDGYLLHLSNGQVIDTHAVIMTLPHRITQKILSSVIDVGTISHTVPTSVATVALAFANKAVQLKQEGTGFVVPRRMDYTITACTWTHKKWPHTTPEGKALLRCYVGRAGNDAIVDQSDEEMIRIVLKDLKRIIAISDDPEFFCITRLKNSMPQYEVGHRQRLNQVLERMETHFPGVFLAGASYAGIGLPDCMDQGKKAVADVIAHVMDKSKVLQL